MVSSTDKTDRHDITEILLKVALNTIKQTNKQTNKQTIHCNWNIVESSANIHNYSSNSEHVEK
jgi:hypothetical protein